MEPISIFPNQMKVEHVDNFTPILKAIDYLNKLLLQDQEEGHLSTEATEAINDSIAELSRALVRATTLPSILVKEND